MVVIYKGNRLGISNIVPRKFKRKMGSMQKFQVIPIFDIAALLNQGQKKNTESLTRKTLMIFIPILALASLLPCLLLTRINFAGTSRFYYQTQDDWSTAAHVGLNASHSFESSEATFSEEIQLNYPTDKNYYKINVLHSHFGNEAALLHDFATSKSAIVDFGTQQCYIMPLDISITLKPEDFINGNFSDYHGLMQRSMLVMIPAVRDFSQFSKQIAAECRGFKVYISRNQIEDQSILQRFRKYIFYNGNAFIQFNMFLADSEYEFDQYLIEQGKTISKK